MGAKIVKNQTLVSKKVIFQPVLTKRKSSNFSKKSDGSNNTPKSRFSNNDVNAIKEVTSRFNNKKRNINTNNVKAVESDELLVMTVRKKNNHEFEDFDIIDNCLMTHFFMRNLDKEAREEIIKEMTLGEVEAGKTVFKQGALGNFFYIVKQGELDLYINDTFTKSLGKGESFGELALLHGAPRSGTVKAKSTCLLWVLERKNFRKIVDHINQLNYEENVIFINSIPILSNIENDLKAVLASNFIKAFYEAGNYILRGKF
jgi:hypothetical protein